MAPVTFGTGEDVWIWDGDKQEYDISRGAKEKGNSKSLKTQKGTVHIDPKKSALVIVDMQNYFLHPQLRKHITGLEAKSHLLKKAIPASRAAGVKVLWVNWGLTQEEVVEMAPCHASSFGAIPRADRPLAGGFGSQMGAINGRDAGRLLMRGTWNTELYDDLQSSYEEGQRNGTDFWIHKDRMSAMWGGKTPMEQCLIENGIKTLFFGGVNADQCVWGTLIDSHNKGYDVCYLTDASATGSPEACLIATEFNANIVGFVSSTEEYANGLLQ